MIVRTVLVAMAAALPAWGALGLLLPAHAQTTAAQPAVGEPASTRRATELRDAPGASGRSLAQLPEGSPVLRGQERQGPWVRVQDAAGTNGWIHMFDLGPPGTAGGGLADTATGALRGLAGLFTRSSPTRVTTPTSTIGIRGLGAEDLAQATPDAAAVTRMEALRATEPQARQFARDAGLAAVPVDALPAPVADATQVRP